MGKKRFPAPKMIGTPKASMRQDYQGNQVRAQEDGDERRHQQVVVLYFPAVLPSGPLTGLDR